MNSLKEKIISETEGLIADIETAVRINLNPHFDLVSDIAGHILFAGGKRLRPLLMILSAGICGNIKKNYATLSSMFEYLHTASLLHDDLIDGASIRRGKPVANSIWGNSAAVLTGDFLLARSLSIAAKTGISAIVEVLAEITEYMSQGEIFQLMNKERLDLSKKEYMKIIKCKTAVLFRGACKTGALIAGAAKDKEAALASYGMNLGIAFQMADDLLDYTSDSKLLGKKTGADIREGKLTLPVIYALDKTDSEDRRFIEKIIINKNFNDDDFNKLIDLLKKYQGLSYTQKLTSEYVEKAKNSLDIFTPSKTKETLLNVADYAMDRKA
ncbi:octaprenyl-diphosphate synthase [Desulfosarcina sp. BuS5]|uniref:polyprenyl synthetase family protein n=1 Tax=Desulfosarcina sp. BuS5 TaxID=933262 RepID=UPI000485AD64|nr:polyprenyl synthetase family protein [Desulfosarcina sp. BuS5]WDN88349.1 octaprenyl-diphosphate synthase [Desulfosarcina sp. BuS5]